MSTGELPTACPSKNSDEVRQRSGRSQWKLSSRKTGVIRYRQQHRFWASRSENMKILHSMCTARLQLFISVLVLQHMVDGASASAGSGW
jgi:hypothetical protein